VLALLAGTLASPTTAHAAAMTRATTYVFSAIFPSAIEPMDARVLAAVGRELGDV
jgi:hypothetical protein